MARKPLRTAPYVRARMQPSAKEYVAERVAANRAALAENPAHPGVRFDGAYDWFRAASAYAARRSYRTPEAGAAALARREQIITDAALVLQGRGCEIDALVPGWFRRSTRRDEFRDAYRKAADPAGRLAAAHGWLLFASKTAARYARLHGSDAGSRAAALRDDAAAALIRWAEEMDADDYGE
jgi:hypothetical protein